jgi:hypothetical protein
MSFQRKLESSILNGFMDSHFQGDDSLLKLSAPKAKGGRGDLIDSSITTLIINFHLKRDLEAFP